mgnify:CR=1 FL=1
MTKSTQPAFLLVQNKDKKSRWFIDGKFFFNPEILLRVVCCSGPPTSDTNGVFDGCKLINKCANKESRTAGT